MSYQKDVEVFMIAGDQSLTKELVLKWCTKYGLLGFAHEEADKILFKPKF